MNKRIMKKRKLHKFLNMIYNSEILHSGDVILFYGKNEVFLKNLDAVNSLSDYLSDAGVHGVFIGDDLSTITDKESAIFTLENILRNIKECH